MILGGSTLMPRRRQRRLVVVVGAGRMGVAKVKHETISKFPSR